MLNFIEFFGSAHLNSVNVAAYKNADGCLVVAENVVTSEFLGWLQFTSYDAALEWFSELGGDGSDNLIKLRLAVDYLIV